MENRLETTIGFWGSLIASHVTDGWLSAAFTAIMALYLVVNIYQIHFKARND